MQVKETDKECTIRRSDNGRFVNYLKSWSMNFTSAEVGKRLEETTADKKAAGSEAPRGAEAEMASAAGGSLEGCKEEYAANQK